MSKARREWHKVIVLMRRAGTHEERFIQSQRDKGLISVSRWHPVAGKGAIRILQVREK